MECPIRCETYTNTNPKVECPICHMSACLKCHKLHLLSTAIDPHCMQCRRPWSDDVVESLFPSNFIRSELRKARIELLAERERAYFPETLLSAQRLQNTQKVKKALNELQAFRKKIVTAMDQQLPIIDEDVDKYNISLTVLQNVRALIPPDLVEIPTDLVEIPTQERHHFIHPCPVNGCLGFLSTAWKCATCDTHVCSKCEEIKNKDDSHQCDPTTVETVQEKHKSAKPCPQCGVYVQKASGCDQMWCTSCKTPFDWTSLKIVTGPIHNPHYFNHIQNEGLPVNNNNNIDDDDPCVQGWPWEISFVIQELPINPTMLDHPYGICRFMNEVLDNETRYHGYHYTPNDTLIIREKRVLGLIDDATWLKQLSMKETIRRKKENAHLIDMTLMTTTRDIVLRYRADCRQMISEMRDEYNKNFIVFTDYVAGLINDVLINHALDPKIAKISEKYRKRHENRLTSALEEMNAIRHVTNAQRRGEMIDEDWVKVII